MAETASSPKIPRTAPQRASGCRSLLQIAPKWHVFLLWTAASTQAAMRDLGFCLPAASPKPPAPPKHATLARFGAFFFRPASKGQPHGQSGASPHAVRPVQALPPPAFAEQLTPSALRTAPSALRSARCGLPLAPCTRPFPRSALSQRLRKAIRPSFSPQANPACDLRLLFSLAKNWPPAEARLPPLGEPLAAPAERLPSALPLSASRRGASCYHGRDVGDSAFDRHRPRHSACSREAASAFLRRPHKDNPLSRTSFLPGTTAAPRAQRVFVHQKSQTPLESSPPIAAKPHKLQAHPLAATRRDLPPMLLSAHISPRQNASRHAL